MHGARRKRSRIRHQARQVGSREEPRADRPAGALPAIPAAEQRIGYACVRVHEIHATRHHRAMYSVPHPDSPDPPAPDGHRSDTADDFGYHPRPAARIHREQTHVHR